MSTADSNSTSSASAASGKPMDPILRNAMRYSLSPREYQLLHKYLIARTPAVRKSAPEPARYERVVEKTDDYNAAAIRASLRVFASAYTGLKLYEIISAKIFGSGKAPTTVVKKPPFWKQGSVRLSASLSLILLFHRLLHRFFTRFRSHLLADDAKAFRQRNPRTAATLTSKLAPAVGASLAGFWLGLYPAAQLRMTIAIYMFSRSLEFSYNYLEDEGYFKNRPWWFGSWLLMPAACGQLLHAFVFDRECFPATYGGFITRNSTTYLQTRPADYPVDLKWPGTFDIVDSLGEISRLRWPKFVSPILFPNTQTLPATCLAISSITAPAHPTIQNLSCALLHPNDPSCLRTYITFFIQAFPGVTRFFAIIYGAFSLLRIQAFIKNPITAFNRLARVILRMSLFVTGAIGTAWGSICLFQHILPRGMLPTQRWVLGGALGGMWAFLERKTGRSNFLYSTRLSIDSLWKVGVKHGWWKGINNGDVLLFVGSLALIGGIYEADPKAINGAALRKGLGMLRGEGWVDRAPEDGAKPEVLENRDTKEKAVPALDEVEADVKKDK